MQLAFWISDSHSFSLHFLFTSFMVSLEAQMFPIMTMSSLSSYLFCCVCCHSSHFYFLPSSHHSSFSFLLSFLFFLSYFLLLSFPFSFSSSLSLPLFLSSPLPCLPAFLSPAVPPFFPFPTFVCSDTSFLLSASIPYTSSGTLR